MFNSYQNYLQTYSSFEYKYTECVDLLNDYDFKEWLDVSSRYDLKTTANTYPIPNYNIGGKSIFYDADTSTFTYTIPIVPYEFKSLNIKAIKTVESSLVSYGNYYDQFITCCSLSNNATNRVSYCDNNLNEGVNFMPINQTSKIDLWFIIPDTQRRYNIFTLSQLYNNFVIELDFIVR